MSDKEPENNGGLFELIKKLWLPLAGFVGAISLVYSFYKTWVDDQTTFTYFIAGGGLFILIVILYWAGFGVRTTRTPAQWPIGSFVVDTEPVLKRPQQIAARIALGSVVIGTVLWLGITGVRNHQENQLKETKFVILVADFLGPDPQNYQVTDELIKQLRDALQPYDDSVVLALGETIEEADGSEYAQSVGIENKADILLWGRYSVLEDEVILNIHIENLSGSTDFLPPSVEYQNTPPVEHKHFEFRERFSQEMGAFTLFMAGMSRYELQDYEAADIRFTSALEQNSWPDDLLNRAAIYHFRGFTRMILGVDAATDSKRDEYQTQALADLNEVIKAFPEAEDGYFYRGQVYYQRALREAHGSATRTENSDRLYQLAIDDMTSAIRYSSDPSAAYMLRGSIYFVMGHHKQALADFQMIPDTGYGLYWQGILYDMLGEPENAIKAYTRAIELEPSWNEVYNPHSKRGRLFVSLGRYDDAIRDFETSHALGEPDYLYYENYAHLFEEKKEYDKSLQYMNEAIRLDPNQPSSLIYSRGLTHYHFQQYQAAIDDFTKDIELNPTELNVFSYYYRSLSYGGLNQFDLALADINQAIAISSNYADAYYARAATYNAMGRQAEADADYAKYKELMGEEAVAP